MADFRRGESGALQNGAASASAHAQSLGSGVIFMALAQDSGELIWWPYIIAKYGLSFLFLVSFRLPARQKHLSGIHSAAAPLRLLPMGF